MLATIQLALQLCGLDFCDAIPARELPYLTNRRCNTSGFLVFEKMSPQATGNSRPVSDACLIVSIKRCRSTATSNVGRRFCPVRTASANRAYI